MRDRGCRSRTPAAAPLPGISATDPLTVAAITALLLGVALVASCPPARRAAKVQRMVKAE